MKYIVFAASLLWLIGCQNDKPKNQPQQNWTPPLAAPCGIHGIENLGTIAAHSSQQILVPGLDFKKLDTFAASWSPSGKNQWTVSTGSIDASLAYLVNGSSVTLGNNSSMTLDWYTVSMVHDCY